ncbi:hypothetical protein [Nannocystis pusilla]|uniref:hypothetical protein n=1 Tax=Nannocystis pusilla TaxID=889268 RepID=UPI003DA42578
METTNPPLETYGGATAKAARVASVFAEQDRVLGHGRRIVADLGLHMTSTFNVPSTNPSAGSQTYPSATTARYAYRGKFTLTPGHFLMAQVVCAPSGQTQKLAASYVASGAGGFVLFDATLDNGSNTTTISRAVSCPPSENQYAGETTSSGAMFRELYRFRVPMTPDEVDAKPEELAKWSDDVTVELTIRYQGGVRPVHVIVYEVPYGYAREFGDNNDWASSCFTSNGETLSKYPVPYPVTATDLGPGDPSNGSTYVYTVQERQRSDLGPLLVCASAWSERAQSVTSSETDPISLNSTTLTDIWQTSLNAWDADGSGWSLASGANARQWNTSGPYHEMRGNDAVVPVRVRVYARRSAGAGIGTIRVWSQGYSAGGQISINSGTWQWWETTAHLRCGLGAEDTSVCQILGSVSVGTTTIQIAYITVEYANL